MLVELGLETQGEKFAVEKGVVAARGIDVKSEGSLHAGIKCECNVISVRRASPPSDSKTGW